MKGDRSVFVCSGCGYECAKWLGRCPGCGQWGTLEEINIKPDKKSAPAYSSRSSAIPFSQIDRQSHPRFSTGIAELDAVAGGGIVPGSLVLCGGDPGIGKSTLLLQLAGNVASGGDTVIYASAEESAQQVKLRADRLGVGCDSLLMLAQTELSDIIAEIDRVKPRLAIVDSVQTVYLEEANGTQGSVSQVRECTSRLMRYAKSSGVAIILVGHVTKEGVLAGPKVLEHLVDTVLYFEGDKNGAFRILRAVKNRFGSVNEIAVFEMTQQGMKPVSNPSAHLLCGLTAAGSSVLCTVEGTRPLMCDVQALVCKTAFPAPRRSANGFDYNRIAMLLAVLEKRAGYILYDKDVYVNAAGGIRIDDPAADLALLAAVASAYRDIAIPAGTVFMGEVGLSGELRSISGTAARVSECMKLGYGRIVLPASGAKEPDIAGAEIMRADTLEQALGFFGLEKRKGRPADD